MKHIDRLNVSLGGRLVGRFRQGERGALWFSYAPEWLETGFDICPQTLSFDAAPQLAKGRVFSGLHGVFNDSLPDGWGMLLMDRFFRKEYDWIPYEVTPLDRLAYVGHRAMGALEYQPELTPDQDEREINISDMAEQAYAFLDGDTSAVIDQLRIQGGSPGGARPKITVALSEDMKHGISGFMAIPDGYDHWMVKFRSQNDPLDVALIEMAYADIARSFGLDLPETALIAGKKESFFAVKRFDRCRNAKIHMLSLSGFLYANHREPCLDYEAVLQATQYLTRDEQEINKAFRLMLFNIVMHNKDDHAKNFAFLYDGRWRLSPAYDLTFNAGINHEHTTAIAGDGNPGIRPIKLIAKRYAIDVQPLLNEMIEASLQWPRIAYQWGVSMQMIADIEKAIDRIRIRLRA